MCAIIFKTICSGRTPIYNLPKHLKKYVVDQNYEKYTPIDQACWRFILRQLNAFLATHAHECYSEGMIKTGVETERIPRIEDISKKLEAYGWRALPVSGFIPPAAFMELQSLGVLPIASDMRTLNHLMYTPAPDIVHEAAGHAPILVNSEFADYLKQYAQVAKKALISKEDMSLYEAIRKLSDIKENPDSTEQDISNAQKHLDTVSKNISQVSEASELSRMNWWTAEYGLIGDIQNPKIFGAGLLSSVGESKWCLGKKVKKIPLTIDCIKFTYDITEPQPQLFVTTDFKTLGKVLEQMANQMAFRVGGLAGLKKAITAETVNTAELNSGLQISGQIAKVLTDEENENPIYIQLTGPSQLAYYDKELPGHDKKYHAAGFGSPVGYLKLKPNLCPSLLPEEELKEMGIQEGKSLSLEFTTGILVEGTLKSTTRRHEKLLLMSFENCKVIYKSETLFKPDWGIFDMAVGSRVVSVFGGPADRESYGDTDDFIAVRVPLRKFTAEEKLLHQQYATVRKLREENVTGETLEKNLNQLMNVHREKYPQDWLLLLETLELLTQRLPKSSLVVTLKNSLTAIASTSPENKELIQDGLALV